MFASSKSITPWKAGVKERRTDPLGVLSHQVKENLQMHRARGENPPKQESLTMFDDPHKHCDGIED